MSNIDGYLSVGRTASILGISVDRVRQLAKTGKLQFVRTPRGRLFDPASVEIERARREEEQEGWSPRLLREIGRSPVMSYDEAWS
jgi:excisionase family DNA binding protein